MTRRLLAAIAAVLMLAACGGPDHGQVAKRRHHDPFTMWHQQCAGYNSQGGCTAWIMVPMFYPESCDLYLVNGDDKGWHGVSCSRFDAYQVGEQYP